MDSTPKNTTEVSVERCALVLVIIGSVLIPFMGSSLGLILPLIQNELAVNILLLGWIPTAFTLANAALVLPFGRLADIHGRKKIFAAGFVVYTLASLLASVSTSGLTLIFFSFLQGAGCALIFATGVALLISIFPPEKRGRVLGIEISAVYLGLFLGPLLGGFLAQNLGWRSIFLINVPIGLFALGLILTRFKGEWKGSDGEKFDLLGSLIYALSLSSLMYGFSTLNEVSGKVFLLAGLVGMAFFFKVIKDSPNPIISLKIFKNKLTRFSGSALLLVTIGTSAMWTLLSLYLQNLRGLDTISTALILAVQPLAVALLSPLVGRWIDKRDNKGIILLGAVVCTLGLLILAFSDLKTPLLQVVVGLLLVGVGLGLFSAPTNQNFLGSLTSKFYGVGSATLSTMIFIGQTLSLGIFLLILTGFLGNVEIAPSNYPLFLEGLNVSFYIFATISALGAVFTYIGVYRSDTRVNN
ncbi:MFS transporter [Methanobacterium sp. BAmetb5]|uniref:MFS transporter n=1 Tax=Methanobacterium sp. BAmetb5 TaxID=2025351 RepID=UPI000E7F6546|nr:MFS transporter [Methanobacterium sp. BAmetb5]AXV39176.1 MAG: MFS transporter [Methanobacterium sp. BAmetb5]